MANISDLSTALHFEKVEEALRALKGDIHDLEDQLESTEIDLDEAKRDLDWVEVKLDGHIHSVPTDYASAAVQLVYDLGLSADTRYSLTQIEEMRLAIERILR